MSIEVMKLALEALEADEQDMVADKDGHMVFRVDVAITALRQAIEQAEKQEPVAWANPHDLQNFDMKVRTNGGPLHTVPLYTTPPQRKPLTEEHIIGLWQHTKEPDGHRIERFARAIEAAHGITGEIK